MTNSPFAMIFQAPPAKNPPLVPRIVSSELPKNVSGRTQGLYELSLTKHPLYQGMVLGEVVKAPMFDPGYTGPKRLDLDVIGTKAIISRKQTIQFTGTVLGPIDSTQPAVYSFQIDTSAGNAIGSAQSQQTVSSTLKIMVTDGSARAVGSISTLDSQGQPQSTVTLPPWSVRVSGYSVQITVPTTLVPSIARLGIPPAITRTSYVFEAAVPGGQPGDIAGFAPGFIKS